MPQAGHATDVEGVIARFAQLLAEDRKDEALSEITEVLRALVTHSSHLEHRLLKLLRERYGRKSERIDAAQLALFVAEALVTSTTARGGEPPDAATAPAPEAELPRPEPKPREGHGRRPLPPELPREEVVLEPPAESRVCATCGIDKTCIGHETSEVLEYVPAHFKVIVTRRAKYACRTCEDGVVIAERSADRPIDGGLPGPGLLAQVLVGKYQDQLPLNRLSKIFARFGVNLSRSTLMGWVAAGAAGLEPIAARIRELVLLAHVLLTDDTGIRVLDRDHPKGSRRGHLWVYVGDTQWCAYAYTPDWRSEGPRSFLAKRRGWVVHDGYAGYDALFEGEDATALDVACWSHARRGLVDALEGGDVRAAIGIAHMRKLFDLERQATEDGVDAEERLRRRRAHAPAVLAALGTWMAETYNAEPPTSPLAKAIAYIVKRWQALSRFLEDGRVPLTNNLSERRLRPIAVGRHNWLFAGSDAGAERAATIYTVLGTCAMSGVEPWAYLRDVLVKLQAGWPQSRLDELLPPNWKLAHPEAAVPAHT